VDIDARWLLFLLGERVVGAWPIGVGKPGSETPPGRYVVGEKSEDPTWFRPGQPPVAAGDARNPLETRWIAWMSVEGTKTHLGFHGTRDPNSIGQDESEGCVRMLNRHVEELYEILPKGTPILVQP
jgi:lipoprotein-anchoring transpeptidase ErfK/SrfK